jgi:hypothetical protein
MQEDPSNNTKRLKQQWKKNDTKQIDKQKWGPNYGVSREWKRVRKIFNSQLSTTVKMPPETWNPIIPLFWKRRKPS